MTNSEARKLKVGDRIKVSTWNREGKKTCERDIVCIDSLGIGIRLFGWNPFYVQPHEIVDKV